MKKRIYCAISFLLVVLVLSAQPTELLVKSSGRNLYLDHKVVPKEGFYSIGRLYSVHPKYVASFNNLDLNKGLSIGQILHIPLTDTNFIQKGNTGTPVYYVAGANEGLMRISTLHRNVGLDHLRNWNNLSDNVVATGSKLVVGFLITKEMPSVTLGRREPVAESPRQETKPPPTPIVDPVAKKETVVTRSEPIAEIKQVPGNEPKKSEPAFANQPVQGSAGENGYFRNHFDQQVKQWPARKNETVTSGIFKTTSGWLDGKYYLLIDGVQPGTIVRITNPSNSKFIFAKVLGEMSGIRQNSGYNIRISSAGASALQIGEEAKFIVKVNY